MSVFSLNSCALGRSIGAWKLLENMPRLPSIVLKLLEVNSPPSITSNNFNVFIEKILNHFVKLSYAFSSHGFMCDKVCPCTPTEIFNNDQKKTYPSWDGMGNLPQMSMCIKSNKFLDFEVLMWNFILGCFAKGPNITIVFHRRNIFIQIDFIQNVTRWRIIITGKLIAN